MLGAVMAMVLSGCDASVEAPVEPAPPPPVVVRTEAATVAQCPHTGSVVSSGLDRNRNGVLDDSEIATRAIVCNTAPVTQPPVIVVRVIAEPPGMNCPAGGTTVQSGPDANGNGSLDDAEVSHTDYICRQPLLTRLAAEPAGAHCVDGGVAFLVGPDLDNDGKLAEAETETTEYECGDVLSRDVELFTDADVAALANIRVITGSLSSQFAPVTSFVLPSLSHIGGSLRVEGGFVLTRFEFPALQEIDGDCSLRDIVLPVVDFPQLRRVGSLDLENVNVPDLSGFPALAEVDRDFKLLLMFSLTSANLPFTSIGGTLDVGVNSDLTQLTAKLADQVGSVSLSDNPQLHTVTLSVIPRHRAASQLGVVDVFFNDSLTDIKVSADQVGGIDISENAMVTKIALSAVTVDNLSVFEVAVPFDLALSTPDLGGAIEFKGDVIISSPLAAMTSTAPVIVDGLCVFDSTLLHTLDAGAPITTRGGVRFSDNALLTDVQPLAFAGTLQLLNNAVLARADFLSLITPGEIGGMAILDNPVLASVASLNPVVRVRGGVDIERNPRLAGVFGPALVELEGGMFISANASLTHLDFPALEHLISNLNIVGNPALQTIQMPALTDADDFLFIQSNPQLRTLAFDALEHADMFFVGANPRLPACQVLALFARVRGRFHSQSGNDDTAPCTP
jgi:hypothetical protein